MLNAKLIFLDFFFIRMEREVCMVCCCLYRHIQIHKKVCTETRNVANALKDDVVLDLANMYSMMTKSSQLAL